MRQIALVIALIATLLPSVAIRATACSVVGCVENGQEFHHDFAVIVRLDGKGFAGANVEILAEHPSEEATVIELRPTPFSGRTSTDGSLRVRNLPAGNYWLKVDVLGTFVTSECFHVLVQPSIRAKRRLTYGWGDLAPTLSRVAGRLIDSQPGTGGNPLWNLIHRIELPIGGTMVVLRNPITSESFSTASDENGAFAFDSVPPGTYVLQAEGGSSDRDYAGSDFVVKLNPTATATSVRLTYRDPGGGSCGGTDLNVTNE